MVSIIERPRTIKELGQGNIDSLRKFVLKVRDRQMVLEKKGEEVSPRDHNELRALSALVDQTEEFGKGIRLWFDKPRGKPMMATFNELSVGEREVSRDVIVGVVQAVVGDKRQRFEYYKALLKGGEIILSPKKEARLSR